MNNMNLDSAGNEMVIGGIYKTINLKNNVKVRCSNLNDLNGTMFIGLDDGMVYLGREFASLGNSENQYFNLERC